MSHVENSESISLRPAMVEDQAILLKWRNDPRTKRFFFNGSRVAVQEHQRWLRSRLQDPNCKIYIVESGGHPIGQVRLEAVRNGTAEVSVSVNASERGRGTGALSLVQAVRKAGREMGWKTFVAHIQPHNIASVVAFVKAGFCFQRLERFKGQESYRLEKIGG